MINNYAKTLSSTHRGNFFILCGISSILKATVNNEETTFMIVKVIHANNPLPIVLNSEFIEEWTGRLLHSANS